MLFRVILVVCFCLLHCATSANSEVKIIVLWEKAVLESAPDLLPNSSVIERTAWQENGSIIDIVYEQRELTGFSSSPLLLSKTLCEAVSSGAVAFIAALTCPTSLLVTSILGELRLPLVSLGSPCLDRPGGKEGLWVYPAHEVSSPLVSIVAELAWKDVMVVYEEMQLPTLELALSALARHSATVRSFRLDEKDTGKSIDDLLDSLRHKEEKNIIVAASQDTMKHILRKSNDYASTHDAHATYQFGSSWLFLGEREDDAGALEPLLGEMDNVAVLVPTVQEEDGKNSMDTLLQEARNLSLVGVREALIVNTTYSASDAFTTSCAQRRLVVDTVWRMMDSLFTMSPCQICIEYEVKSAFWLADRERKLQTIATWGPYGLNLSSEIFPNLQYGLNGRHLVVATLEWDPFVRYVNSSVGHNGFEGFTIQILEELAINLNFSFDLIGQPDGMWGGKDNKTWLGLIGSLVRRDVDLVVTALAISHERSQVVDFTDFYFLEYSAALVKYADPASTKWRLYLEPYTWEVWVMFAGTIPLGTLVAWFFTRCSYYYTEDQRKRGLGLVDNAAIFIFGSCFQQGGVHIPTSQSGRFFVGFWWMYVIVVVATYSGNLIAYLTVSRSSLPFDTLEEMVAKDGFKFGVLDNTALVDVLERASGGVYKAMYDNIKEWEEEDPDVLSTHNDVHLKKVMSGDYAYLGDKTAFEVEMTKYCNLNIIKETFAPSEYAIALQHNSAFTKIMSEGVTNIKETGVLNKWKGRWWPRPIFCPSRESVTEAKSVSIVDIQGAYYTLAMLLGLAVITLLIEHVIHLLSSSQLSKNKVKIGQQHSTSSKHDKKIPTSMGSSITTIGAGGFAIGAGGLSTATDYGVQRGDTTSIAIATAGSSAADIVYWNPRRQSVADVYGMGR